MGRRYPVPQRIKKRANIENAPYFRQDFRAHFENTNGLKGI